MSTFDISLTPGQVVNFSYAGDPFGGYDVNLAIWSLPTYANFGETIMSVIVQSNWSVLNFGGSATSSPGPGGGTFIELYGSGIPSSFSVEALVINISCLNGPCVPLPDGYVPSIGLFIDAYGGMIDPITTPLPSALPLFAIGLLLFVWMRKWR
jgi:hypothetical protein